MIDGRQERKIMLDKFFTLKITYYRKAQKDYRNQERPQFFNPLDLSLSSK